MISHGCYDITDNVYHRIERLLELIMRKYCIDNYNSMMVYISYQVN